MKYKRSSQFPLGFTNWKQKSLSQWFAALCGNQNILGDGEGKEINNCWHSTDHSQLEPNAWRHRADFLPSRQDGTCVWGGRGPPGSRQYSSNDQGAAPWRAPQRLSGFCTRTGCPPERAPSRFTSGHQRREVCAEILETLLFWQILHAVFPNCLYVIASCQARDPKVNKSSAGQGKTAPRIPFQQEDREAGGKVSRDFINQAQGLKGGCWGL